MKNNTLALLAGILIIISTASILVSPKDITFVTGFASSGDSYTTFNMSEEVSVLVSGSIDFGSGRVNPDASQATLDSELGYHYNWFNITNLSSGPRPSPRWTNVIYDPGRDVFLMYGYLFSYYPLTSEANETWQFNYSSMGWTNITATAGRPTFVDGFTPVYDSFINAVIMYKYGTFYKFNSSGQWELLSATGEAPYPVRKDYAMAFDSRRNVSVLFGGRGGGLPYAGTWEFTASNNKWTNKSSENEPHARAYAAMAFDSNRNVSVLYGGAYGGQYFYDTWEYNGTGWTDVTGNIDGYPTGNGREYPSMTYDSARKKVVLFGGDGMKWFNDTWEYDGKGWVHTADIPVGRRTSITFDSSNNKTLLFYGEGNTPTNFLNDTWEYNATDMDAGTSANGTWYFEKGFFNIENDGTVNINVNYTADKNAEVFIGGTNPSFKIKGVVGESNACPDLNITYAEVPNSTETPKVLCPMLKFGNVADTFMVPVRLVVPSDAPAGDRSATITFSAVKV